MEKKSKRGVPPPNGILNFPDIEKKPIDLTLFDPPKWAKFLKNHHTFEKKKNFSQRKKATQRNGEAA